MQDYLQSGGKRWRIVCAVACTLATILFLFFFGVLCVMAYQHGFHKDGNGLAVALFIMALLTFFTAFMSWRFWRGTVSGNGVTTLPSWFIQLFGVFLLVGVIVVAFAGGGKISFAEGVLLAASMILVGRNIARRKKTGG